MPITYVLVKLICYLEPLPPGPIDINASDFHPEHLYISWEKPANDTRVEYYYVTIDGYRYHTENNAPNIHWPRRLRPGKNYTVSIQTKAPYCCSNGKRYSDLHQEQIETMRKSMLH